MGLINIDIDDGGLTDKLAYAEKILPDHNQDGVHHVAELGKDKARDLAPFEVGYLYDAITATPAEGGVYAEAEVYIRGGEPPSHGKPADAYGAFQEEGFLHEGSGKRVRNPFMEPAAGYLNAGVAELTMDQAMFLALEEADLDPGIGGLIGA